MFRNSVPHWFWYWLEKLASDWVSLALSRRSIENHDWKMMLSCRRLCNQHWEMSRLTGYRHRLRHLLGILLPGWGRHNCRLWLICSTWKETRLFSEKQSLWYSLRRPQIDHHGNLGPYHQKAKQEREESRGQSTEDRIHYTPYEGAFLTFLSILEP